jgi:arylsulfatase A-like enzyme
MTPPPLHPRKRLGTRTSDVLVLALWCGLVMGLGESAIFFAWKAAGVPQYVSVDVIWAAIAFDTFIALAFAATLLLASRFAPAIRSLIPLGLSFLVLLNWTVVGLHGRLYVAAMVMLAGGLAVVVRDRLARLEGGAYRLARRSFAPVAALALVGALLGPLGGGLRERMAVSSLPEARAGAPNVLVLLIDTFRADHASLYGYERETTPRITEFAEGGVVFDRAFSTSSYTLASHASLLTGLLPHEHGAEWTRDMDYWDCECAILGSVLQQRGYVTSGYSANPFWFTREYGFARGFHRFEDFFDSWADALARTGYGRAIEQAVLPRLGYLDIPGRKSAEFMNRRFLRWMDRRPERPFFAFINYFDVHDPYLPPDEDRTRFSGKDVGGIINWRINGIDPDLDAAVLADEMAAYDGAITYVDRQIGALLDDLEARGVLDNTIVIITSDHGEEFGEHGGLVLHGHSLYSQATHVPLVIRGPGVPSGVRITESVTNAAVPSTVAALALDDAPFPLSPLVGGGETFDAPVTELTQKPWGSERHPTYYGTMQSVVEASWHLIRHETFGLDLYDLDADPAEQNDRAADAAQAGRLEHMTALLDSLSTGGGSSQGRDLDHVRRYLHR